MLIITRNKTVYVRRRDILDISITASETIDMLTKEDDIYGSIIEICCEEQDDLCVVYNAILHGFETRNGIVDIRINDNVIGTVYIRRRKKDAI